MAGQDSVRDFNLQDQNGAIVIPVKVRISRLLTAIETEMFTRNAGISASLTGITSRNGSQHLECGGTSLCKIWCNHLLGHRRIAIALEHCVFTAL